MPNPTKEKTLILALHFNGIAGMGDDAICALTGLSKQDLDDNWAMAEAIYQKARTKPEVPPAGDELTEAIKSWVDYYFHPN